MTSLQVSSSRLRTMLAKLTQAQLDAVGAKTVAEFPAALDAYISQTQEFVSDTSALMDKSTDLTSRVQKLESDFISLEKRVVLLEGVGGDAKAIESAVASAIPAAMTAWAGSADGKKLIGAEASRITAEAMAATGTQPAKPAPAPGGNQADANEQQIVTLKQQGKFEEAFALLPLAERREYLNAKEYAAFMRAAGSGVIGIKILKSAKDFAGRN